MKKQWSIAGVLALALTAGSSVTPISPSVQAATHPIERAGRQPAPLVYQIHGVPTIIRTGARPNTDCGGTGTQTFTNISWAYNSSTKYDVYVSYGVTLSCQVYFTGIGVRVDSGYIYTAHINNPSYTAWVSASTGTTPVYAHSNTINTCPTNIAHNPNWSSFNMDSTQYVSLGTYGLNVALCDNIGNTLDAQARFTV